MGINIRGGAVLLETGLETFDIGVDGDVIADQTVDAALEINAEGLIVAPGLVDIHGDAFERQIMPRSGVFFPLDIALIDTDRQLAANGITTAYHALTLSWEPGLRSVEQGEAMVGALEAGADRLTVDHRIQLRWETFCFEALPLIRKVLNSEKKPALAFNDHTSMTMRPAGQPVTERAFDLARDNPVISLDDPELLRRVEKQSARAGMSGAEFTALLEEVWSRRPEVENAIRALGSQAAGAGVPMLSHDDSQLATREFYRAAGAEIAEFPMSDAVARAARAEGEHVVLGSPNVVRGGSHIGSLSAADMIADGVCTVLASDYHYPAMLAAAGRLWAEKRASLPQIWATVSANPADALGLADRGEIAPGKRADLVLLDWPEGGTPVVRATISAGQVAWLSGDLLR